MKNNDAQIIDAANELIEDNSPADWISWLFDIQNTLIGNNCLEGYNAKGNMEFADQFGELKTSLKKWVN